MHMCWGSIQSILSVRAKLGDGGVFFFYAAMKDTRFNLCFPIFLLIRVISDLTWKLETYHSVTEDQRPMDIWHFSAVDIRLSELAEK